MPKVAIIMGSVSDLEVVKPAVDILKKFDVETHSAGGARVCRKRDREQYRSHHLRGGQSGAFGRSYSGVYAVAGNRAAGQEFDYGRIGFVAVDGADAFRHTGGVRGDQRRTQRGSFGDTDTFRQISQPYEKNAGL